MMIDKGNQSTKHLKLEQKKSFSAEGLGNWPSNHLQEIWRRGYILYIDNPDIALSMPYPM